MSLDGLRHTELAISRQARLASPLEAEVSGEADWYLVQTRNGNDVGAMRWLARRRFGVFRPMMQKRDRNGGLLQGWQPVFPGWLFVFLWDARKMQARLKACPGVYDIFCDPVTNQPVPIDRCDFVARLRRMSHDYLEQAPRQRRHAGPIGRPSRQERRQLDRLKDQLKHRGYARDHEIWTLAHGLAPHQRIALLMRTLACAPPSVGCLSR